jgi:lipopolysaccharide export system permease protein
MSRITLRSIDLPRPALRLGRIERYVLVQQLGALGVALGVISALVMLIDFVEISRGHVYL